ncbi:MAG TPA: aminoglycoside phosphotransferase family protein [Pilimelia sp.]|nr:aminoglycoside phosphotransferase family protein [Pilimelia sp.]
MERGDARAGPASPGLRIPESFLAAPRWRRDGARWLKSLPQRAAAQCARWHLDITGDVAHGSHAIVVPVCRAGAELVLRLTPPGPEVAEQVAALRFWAGRGTVQLVDADIEAGAMLLERLAVGTSLRDVPVAEAMPILGRMVRRLAIPAPPDVPSTADAVAHRLTTLEPEWARRGRPFDRAILGQALAAGSRLSRGGPDLAVNGDLHSAQVLRGTREPWLTVDPVLMRGDIAYDLARVLWTRVDEMPDAARIVGHLQDVADAAGIDRDHARDWVLLRAVDYWLWGLSAGFTEDPLRCRRLALALAG